MGSTKKRPNEVGRYEHERQIEMFTAEEDGRTKNDPVSVGDPGDIGRDHGTQGNDEAGKGSEGGIQVYKHEFLMNKYEENPLKGKMYFSDFIHIKHKALDADFCEHVIEKFNEDPNVDHDRTFGGVKPEMQKRRSLGISLFDAWKEEDEHFHKVLNENLQEYNMVGSSGVYKDLGYKIAHQNSNGYYHWHHDAHWDGDWCRVLSFLWYLNGLNDGYTEFFEGTRVYPQTGKLLMFPANQLFFHRSSMTKRDKFICTGWIYEKRYGA